MSDYSEAWLTGPSDTQFYARTYEAADPKAVLVFVHGAAEHVGRFAHNHLLYAKRGIMVFAYDRRGSGRTALDQEHRSADSMYGKTDWKSELKDMEWAIRHVQSTFSSLPVFLMGDSLGGGLILGFVAREDAPRDVLSMLSGVIIASPTLLMVDQPPRLMRWIISLLCIVSPNVQFPFRNNAQNLSRNPETNEAYIRDPLIRTAGSVKIVRDLVTEGEALLEKNYQYWPEDMPVLFIHGTGDKITMHQKTVAFYDSLSTKDKQVILYEGAFHELHNEPDGVAEKMVDDCVKFMEAHLGHRL
ncbi:alpha/beta-hydrolase [Laetiporus sulphureus 93-53]|uniref:Alpha/beta-hydrolase n=1 Tax=Laetiporus sulphureus 93-53 TaxID=1314785 RepID=A0A165DWE7_9APHY|nr:alpha/beta-hydrolase [Laetiporus sulphureus 93-53]KZT05769.1 alpha/beta-hydrolase [Laetiporus sulphureus 93-53]